MWRTISLIVLVSIALIDSMHGQTPPFQSISKDSVPEGKAVRTPLLFTKEECQSACGEDSNCKAFAFQTSKRRCYFYTVLGSKNDRYRSMGMFTAGLSTTLKRGYVSAFKASSFPNVTFFRAANDPIKHGDELRFLKFVGGCLLGMERIAIKADGTLSLPLIGKVQAVGLTPSQLVISINSMLSEYLWHPEVSIEITHSLFPRRER